MSAFFVELPRAPPARVLQCGADVAAMFQIFSPITSQCRATHASTLRSCGRYNAFFCFLLADALLTWRGASFFLFQQPDFAHIGFLQDFLSHKSFQY